jgi:cell division protein FtsL
MPTICVNSNDEGFAFTTRITIDEGYDTPEVRKRLENKFQKLVLEQLNHE